MEQKLPNVFANAIEKNFDNSQDFYDGRGQDNQILFENFNEGISIETKINRIFNSPYHVYKSLVEIKIGDQTYQKTIIGKTSHALLTQDNELLDINKIKDIKLI